MRLCRILKFMPLNSKDKRIFFECLLEVLEEDKWQEIEKKHPVLKVVSKYWKEANVPIKYLDWMAKQVISADDENYFYLSNKYPKVGEDVWKYTLPNIILSFDKLIKTNRISEKDINRYKTLKELDSKIDEAEKVPSKRQEKLAQKSGGITKLYEDDKILVIEPKTKEASCFYGRNTKWCISATETENHFDRYISDGYRFLFIIDKNSQEKYAISWKSKDNFRVFDRNDNDLTDEGDVYAETMVKQILPQEGYSVVNKYLGFNFIFDPNQFINSIKNKPWTDLEESIKFIHSASEEQILQVFEHVYLNENLVNDALHFINETLKEAVYGNRRGLSLEAKYNWSYKLYKILLKDIGKLNEIHNSIHDLIVGVLLKFAVINIFANKFKQKDFVRIGKIVSIFERFSGVISSAMETAISEENFIENLKKFDKKYFNFEQFFEQINPSLLWEASKLFRDNGYSFQNLVANTPDTENITETNIKNYVNSVLENVLDKMGKKKVSKNIRRGSVSGPVYTEFPSSREKEVVKKVSKNLNKIPYSHDPPIMGISEDYNLNEVLEILEEGRFEDAISKNPKLKIYLQKAKADGLKPKYIDWFVKQMLLAKDMRERRNSFESLISLLSSFDKEVENNRISKKDINFYKNIDDLYNVIEKIEDTVSNTKLRKLSKGNSTKHYEDQKYVIIEPLSMEASCYYGYGTKWCISAVNKDLNSFPGDQNQGVRYLFVIDKTSSQKTAVAFLPNSGKTVEIYDEKDQYQNDDYILDLYPKNIINTLSGLTNHDFERFDINTFVNKFPSIIHSKDQEKFLNNASVEQLQSMLHVIRNKMNISEKVPQIMNFLKKIEKELYVLQKQW